MTKQSTIFQYESQKNLSHLMLILECYSLSPLIVKVNSFTTETEDLIDFQSGFGMKA